MTADGATDAPDKILSAAAEQGIHHIEQSLLPMAVLALDGSAVLVNDALCRMLARDRKSLVEQPFSSSLRTPADRTAMGAELAVAASGQVSGELAQDLLTATGQVVAVRLSWTLGRGPAGQPCFLTATFVHQAAQGPAERALAATEARARAVLAHAADVIWTADADGVVLSVTTAPGPLGWVVSDSLGRCAADLVHHDDLLAFQSSWDRVVAEGGHRDELECRLQRANETWTWVRLTLTDLADVPHVGAVLGHVVDISESRRRRERTQDLERRQTRFESSPAPQARVELDGTLSAANSAFCALVEQPWEELRGLAVSRLSHAEDDGRAEGLLAHVLAGRQESTQTLLVVAGRDGRPVSVSMDVTLLRDASGTASGGAIRLYDLTALHDSSRQRELQEDFVAAIARLAGELAVIGDADGQLIYVSPMVTQLFGYTVAEMLNVEGWDFLHPDDVETARSAYRDVVAEGGARTLLLRMREHQGDWHWVEQTATNMLDTGLGGIVCTMRDVTARVESERALRASESRYRTFADAAEEGIWAVEIDGRTLYANARMADMLGLPLQQLYDQPAALLLDPEGDADVAGRLRDRAQRGAERYEIGYQHPDGVERRLWIVATPLPAAEGVLDASLAIVSDVTAARQTEQELLRAAWHDALTGLPNRTLLLNRLEQALHRETATTAVMLLDLDRFKFVNDSRGHAFGDQLLVAVADRLRDRTRENDTVARFGGDEFVVLCEDVDEEQAEEIADGLRAVFASSFDVNGTDIHVEASIGVAVSPPPSASDLLRYADTAMYSAKTAGRGRIRLFDRALIEETDQRHALSADLRVAIAGDALTFHYQPIVDLRSGRVCGVEALARWDHPIHGAIPPTRFVPLAELNGLASDLDRWAVRRAVREGGELLREATLPAEAYVAINLSAANLAEADLEAFLLSQIGAAGMSAPQVVLEITESAVMNDTHAAIGVLRRLRARGFRVAVDDFGTGYSSLAYLRDLPVTHLKIDRSFVTDIADDPDALAVAASIVDLARAVGLTAVAEGVETPQQATLLRGLGCPTAQGWLWSRALSPADFRDLEVGRSTHDIALCLLPIPREEAEPAAVGPEHGLLRIVALHRKGASLVTIAAVLNRDGYCTPTGMRWHGASVARAISGVAYPSLAAVASQL